MDFYTNNFEIKDSVSDPESIFQPPCRKKRKKNSMKWLPTLSASNSELSPPVKSCPIKKLALLDPKFHFLESDPLFAQLWLPEIIQVLKIELLFNLPPRDLGIGSHQP